jgi:GntR family transcriptional regulator, transcriptional repressor for pyruvate dehydrogenase complex
LEIFKFDRLQTSRISEQVEVKLREAILGGRLKSGDRLPTEKEMARQFGVSVVTLREALRSLEIFGLVQKKKGQGGGIFISDMNNESIKTPLGFFLELKDLLPQHLYEVRKIVEPPAINLAAKKASPAIINKLEENVSFCEEKLLESSNLFTEKDFYVIDRKNVDFHRLIAEGSCNPILSLTIDYVLDFINRYVYRKLRPDFNFERDTVKEHREILLFLKQRDGDTCENKMISHLKRLEEYLICFLGNPPSFPDEIEIKKNFRKSIV